MEADDLKVMQELFGEENVFIIEKVSDLEALEFFLEQRKEQDGD